MRKLIVIFQSILFKDILFLMLDIQM